MWEESREFQAAGPANAKLRKTNLCNGSKQYSNSYLMAFDALLAFYENGGKSLEECMMMNKSFLLNLRVNTGCYDDDPKLMSMLSAKYDQLLICCTL